MKTFYATEHSLQTEPFLTVYWFHTKEERDDFVVSKENRKELDGDDAKQAMLSYVTMTMLHPFKNGQNIASEKMREIYAALTNDHNGDKHYGREEYKKTND